MITNNYEISSENCKTNKISDHEVINISLASMGDKHKLNAMLKGIIKYDDCEDLNQNVNLFDSGLKSVIQRLTIKNQTHLNNKIRLG